MKKKKKVLLNILASVFKFNKGNKIFQMKLKLPLSPPPQFQSPLFLLRGNFCFTYYACDVYPLVHVLYCSLTKPHKLQLRII